MTLPGLSAPRSFRSCRHGQVQEPHRTQPVPNLAQRQHRETLVTKHESLKKVDLKFLRKTRSAQEHSREGLQTTRAGSAPVGAVEACPEPKESEPQVPTGAVHAQGTHLPSSPEAWPCAGAHITKGPEVPGQGSNQGPGTAVMVAALPKAPRPPQRL